MRYHLELCCMLVKQAKRTPAPQIGQGRRVPLEPILYAATQDRDPRHVTPPWNRDNAGLAQPWSVSTFHSRRFFWACRKNLSIAVVVIPRWNPETEKMRYVITRPLNEHVPIRSPVGCGRALKHGQNLVGTRPGGAPDHVWQSFPQTAGQQAQAKEQ